MSRFGLTENEIEMITKVLQRYDGIEEAGVFGSRSLILWKRYSDIDIFLKGDVDRSVLGEILLKLDELPLPYTFDVKVYNSIEHKPLKEHIDRFGQIFYSSH